jgi:hypothetical protein
MIKALVLVLALASNSCAALQMKTFGTGISVAPLNTTEQTLLDYKLSSDAQVSFVAIRAWRHGQARLVAAGRWQSMHLR